MNLTELNQLENSLIEKFKSHKTFRAMEQMGRKQFLDVLLQKRFHSLAFTPLYDIAIDGMENEQGKQIAREILREEYPAKMKSHREDLVEGLTKIGVPKKEIMNTAPSEQTISTLKELFAMLKIEEPQDSYDVKALTILRFWGEVLVSEEYSFFIKKLSLTGLPKEKSRFYWPHYVHDKKKVELDDTKSEKRTHSDRLTLILQKLLNSEEKLKLAAKTEEQILKIKEKFYSQFD